MCLNKSDHMVTEAQHDFLRQMGTCPPFVVWAFENTVAIKTLIERLQAAELVGPPEGKSDGPQDDVNEPQPPLDLICVLGQGVCLNIRSNNPMGVLMVKDHAGGSPVEHQGWVWIPTTAPLAHSLAWMNQLMPRILRGGSVFTPYLIPPMKMAKYMVSTGQAAFADASNAEPGITAPQNDTGQQD
jgi:hypothetical protein